MSWDSLNHLAQRFALWLLPEDMTKGCGYGSASTASSDPFTPACDGHDDFFAAHVGSVVKGDRKFFSDMLRICADTAEKSINLGCWYVLRCMVYLFFVRTVGVFLYWRLGAKKS